MVSRSCTKAKSKYEYVKQFEQDDALLPGCWIVIRIDGKGFTKCAVCVDRARLASAVVSLKADVR